VVCAESATPASGAELTGNPSCTALHSRSRTNCDITAEDENHQTTTTVYDNASQIKHGFGPTLYFANDHRAVRYFTVFVIISPHGISGIAMPNGLYFPAVVFSFILFSSFFFSMPNL